ncbi:DUF4383 domain-containing protein [Mycobacterium sp. 852002-51057_SCH5723018]|uniref:DUF4383 domain-containing protein n=1 Tax=Mycobacterium sp. 852002-51057_SCH5723018 TaxID=1834094 RepID=UPI000801965E|nr:DUF4383 domain-containing protein [Mycobacterium sp. 852002-51057_SCH5723018]OBG28738.1 hypothetical protein A5764_24340 [Mycobacterium sp. 852002-51057_SCH5723018]
MVRASQWYCVVVGLFLAVRAASTLAVGANFELPGNGWRAIWQLVLAALMLIGVARPRAAWPSVAVVGVVYAVATGLDAFHGDDLFGIVPVDMRDGIVHPLLAIVAALTLLLAWRRADAVT